MNCIKKRINFEHIDVNNNCNTYSKKHLLNSILILAIIKLFPFFMLPYFNDYILIHKLLLSNTMNCVHCSFTT